SSAGGLESETGQVLGTGDKREIAGRRAVVVSDSRIGIRTGDGDVGRGGGDEIPICIDGVDDNAVGDGRAGGLGGRDRSGFAGGRAWRSDFAREQNLKLG